MALTETDIKIIIAAELKKQGFDKAERATSKLEKSFKRLGGTIVSVFAARKLIQFTKDSAMALAEEDRAVRSLATSMENLGLAFEGANIEGFVADLQRSVAVSDNELRPALQGLVNATLDIGKAQQLLALALDISAATGKDLTAVTNGLSRAYLKDLSALSRLNIGLTAAQLKTMSFEEAQAALSDRFSGQAAAAADSYEGKIRALNIAFDEAQETIGAKFIRSLEILGDGDFEKVIDGIANAAEKVANAFVRASYGVQKLKALLKGDFDQIAKLQESMNVELAGFGTKLGAAGAVQRMQQQLKIQKQIVAERSKAAAIAEKEKKNQIALNKAKAVFDLDKIQIEAALQGKITEEERTRLLLMKAIAEENVDEATKLAAKLKDLQDQTIKLAAMLTSFPKANDPFADWLDTLAKLHKSLIDIEGITKNRDSSVSAGNAAMAAGDYAASLAQSYTAKADATVAIAAAANAAATATTPEEKAAADAFKAAAESANAAADALSESVSALAMIAAMADLQAATDLYNESLSAVSSTGAGSVTVNVNVEGSVISEGDLAETITNIQYEMQRRGQTVLIDSVAI